MGFLDCCSTFLAILPNPSLPLLPAFLLGTFFAAIILLYMYKKETNLPLSDILLHMIKSVFYHLPSSGCSAGHCVADQCDSVQCVRCQRYGEVRQQIGERWMRCKKGEGLARVEQAVRRLEGKGRVEEREEDEERKEETEESGGKLKYRGKLRGHGDSTLSHAESKRQMRDQEEETYGEEEDDRESTPGNQGNDGNTADKRAAMDKEEMQEKGGKQDFERKKEGKQKTQMCDQKPTLFQMDLPANPSWNEYDVHVNEQKLLKLNFELITQEYDNVFKRLQSGDATGWKNNNIPQGHWCIFPFVDQGKIVPSNCRSCPGVAEIILGCLPAMMNDCVFGNAAFSILYPDSHITPHHGPTNLRLRCHLGIKVPTGCWLEVAGQQYKWRVGETFLFDDSFTHSAHFANQPSSAHSEPRAVLLLDFWHPDVSAEEKECLLGLLTPLE